MRYLIVLLLAGCATYPIIDYTRKPPSDWPNLEERVQYINQEILISSCRVRGQRYAEQALGCARTDFGNGVCWIFLATTEERAIEHERAHCRGFDHKGDNAIRQAWERYKARSQ